VDEETKMIPRIVGTLLLSLVGFVVVSLVVSLGVLWLTGGVVRGAVIGAVCGLAAAFVVGAASSAGRRTDMESRGEANDDNSGVLGRRTERSDLEQDDPQRSDRKSGRGERSG
jgi:hypothetical protein